MEDLKKWILFGIGWIAFMVTLGFLLRIAFFFSNIGWSLLD